MAASSNSWPGATAGQVRQPDERRRPQAHLPPRRRQGPAGTIERDRPAVVEHEAAVHPPEHRRRVLDAQDRRPAAGEAVHQVRDGRRAGRVELGGRLVEDEHVRAHRDDAGDGHALLLATRQRERLALGEVRDRQALEDAVDARDPSRLAARRGSRARRRAPRARSASMPRAGSPASRRRCRPGRGAGSRRRCARRPPAIVTLPPTVARTTRGMNPDAARASVDLPAPVRPATPTRSPAATVRSTSCRLGWRRPG